MSETMRSLGLHAAMILSAGTFGCAADATSSAPDGDSSSDEADDLSDPDEAAGATDDGVGDPSGAETTGEPPDGDTSTGQVDPGEEDAGEEGAGEEGASEEDSGSDDDPDPAPDVHGLISILDLQRTNGDDPWSGGVVEVDYWDTADRVVIHGDPDVSDGTCTVWMHEVGDDAGSRDEGALTIADALSPVGTCTWTPAGYRCPIVSGTLAPGYPLYEGLDGLATVGALGNEFEGMDLVGAHLELSGYANPSNNGLFAVSYLVSAAATVHHPNAVSETLAGAAEFTAYAGVGPSRARRDFLGDGTAALSIAKAAGPEVEAFELAAAPSGHGLTFGFSSASPDEMWHTNEDATFNFEAADGGNAGNNGGDVTRTLVQGRTSDTFGESGATIGPPTGPWVSFECRAVGSDVEVTVPAETIAAIVATEPLGIETRVLRVNEVVADQTVVHVGHGLSGLAFFGI